MKIRTLNIGFNLELPLKREEFEKIAEILRSCKKLFEEEGYFVQTTRVTTQPWEEYIKSKDQIVKLSKILESFTRRFDIDYFSVGTTTDPNNIEMLFEIIKNSSNGFCSTLVSNNNGINYDLVKQTSILIKELSKIDENGFANLRFAALFNVKPGNPFFPASYHEGPTSLTIGTENGDLVNKAFSKVKNIDEAKSKLLKTLNNEFQQVEKIAERFTEEKGIVYGGIDVSIATSVKPNESVVYAFEKLGIGNFGGVGTLSVAYMVTEILKRLDVTRCGYSGLMLPVLEDYALAHKNIEGSYNLHNLLLYSSICGTGLDSIPLPGNVSEEKIYALLLDVASISKKLNKQLSARLMPIPNKNQGEMTEFDFEYFVNSKIMKI